MKLIYDVLFCLALPFVFLRVLWRAQKEPRYKENIGQRLGLVTLEKPRCVWVHAVSAGETIAAAALVRQLVKAGHHVLVTNMTPAGRQRAEVLFCTEIQEGKVSNAYAPYDVFFAVARFYQRVKPIALIVIDTELWPNMLSMAKKNQVPSYVVNGRLSIRSARGYGRIASLSHPMFESISCVFAQSESQAQRFSQLGASSVVNAGSIKFDAKLPRDFDSQVGVLNRRFAGREKILLAASTHDGEEQLMLDAYQEYSNSSSLLILAPRHVHRIADVEKLLVNKNLAYQKHSESTQLQEGTRVYLLDTMGELIYFYGACTNALVGGSLVDVGGHNPMEPGMLGKPMMMGPYRRNIADIADLFAQSDCLTLVNSASDVIKFWQSFDVDSKRQIEMSARALVVTRENQGALSRVMEVIEPHLQLTLQSTPDHL